MSIQQLPENVISQIKSSTTITSLNGVICGLVKNSLDANATRITVSVDYGRGNCSVEDNGLGIPPAEFKVNGGLGKLHYTSKYPASSDVHGKHGTFLASLGSLSLFSITSHHYGHHSHNSIKIHKSEVLARYTPSLPEQRLLSFPHGTRTTARDLFGSMPVRVKQRAIDAERGANVKEWERLKRALAALLLAWPGQISISVRDAVDQRNYVIRAPEENPKSVLELPSRVSKILRQAQLSDESTSDTWVPLKASVGRISVTGAVSLAPVATRRIQFISIGVQPVSNEHGSNVLYEEINRLFANSSFGVEEEGSDIDEDEQKRRAKDRRYKTDGYTNQELKGRKGVDRWPMFHIKVDVADRDPRLANFEVEELLDDRHESLRAIVDLLKAVMYEFLKKHHFRPKYFKPSKTVLLGQAGSRDKRDKSSSRGSTPKTDSQTDRSLARPSIFSSGDLATTRLKFTSSNTCARPESPFDLWTRIKSGRPHNADLPAKHLGEQERSVDLEASRSVPGVSNQKDDPLSDAPLIGPDGKLLRIPFPDVEIDTVGVSQKPTPTAGSSQGEQLPFREGEEILWTNPATQETSVVNARTGFVIRPLRGSVWTTESPVGGFQPSRKRLRTSADPVPENERSEWINDLLSSWENPVFQSREPPIPVAFDEVRALSDHHCHGCKAGSWDTLQASHNIEGRVSKAALRGAEVIAQVDRKFIFAKVPLSSSSTDRATSNERDASLLVIIDQHAADERCRVEALMRDYFVVMQDAQVLNSGAPPQVIKAQTELMEKPIKFDISAQDCRQFEHAVEYFEHWGIVFQTDLTLKTTKKGKESAQLKVVQLPPSIAERCRLEPRLLIDLLRKEVWKLDEQGYDVTVPHEVDAEDANPTALHWLARFHGCPQGILDMINSRACRSSVMFNDQLSHGECVDLVNRLAGCALPFQCAHGRPSMVPLVDLGNSPMAVVGGTTTESEEPGRAGFGREFRRWKSDLEAGG
ncbi:hypothetical protein F4779DRAFT_589424 [Xylariaceae sp. FL0662B]|nr:hypothetical protein F4779DRAFT_589424 [Xylariaceae sp. FL0662B]